MNSREAILNKIRAANQTPSIMNVDNPGVEQKIQEGIVSVTPEDLWGQFKAEFELISGKFYSVIGVEKATDLVSEFISENKYNKIGTSGEEICESAIKKVQEHSPKLKVVSSANLSFEERKQEFASIELSVVHPSFVVADIGALVFLYNKTGTSLPHFLCDNTFALVKREQIVANQFELFEKLSVEDSKNMVFVAGPSRTADIEKILVLGAHGPRNLTVILVNENYPAI